MTYTVANTTPFRRPARRLSLSAVLGAWRSRQQLKVLDDRALEDIGLTRAEAQAESNRPIWDVPATWRS